MIGKHQISIDASNLVKGVSSGANVTDGGFSNETDQINLTKVPGVAYAPAAVVDSDTDTRLGGNIIASSPDMNVASPTNRLLVADDGKGYRYNGTKISAAGVALTAGQTWTKGFTDIITFGGEAYISSKASLTRWQNDDTIDGGGSWPFSFTNATVPHPGIVYEAQMYWGDKNLLLTQAAVGDSTAPSTVLTLSADQVIVALGIDPASGRLLISTTNVLDISATLTGINRLHWYDGNSAKVDRVALVDSPILGFRTVGSTVYVGYGNNIGYLLGSGIQFLRRLNNVTLDNTLLPYKHNITNIDHTLYVLDGLQAMAYGEVLPGRKVWYPALYNNTNSNKPTFLSDVGNKKLGYGFATTKFYTIDTSSVATTSALTLYSHRMQFERPVFIRGFYVEYADAVTSGDNNRSLYTLTEAQGAGFQIVNDPTNAFSALKNTSASSVYFIEVPTSGMANDKVRFLQLRYNASTTNFGLRRIIIYYDPAE